MNWRLHSSVVHARMAATFAQEVEELLKSNAPFSPEERVAVSRYFRSQHPEIQPSLTLDEISGRIGVSDFVVDASVAVKWFVAETDFLVADELSASNHRLFAPRLIMTEVANTLARKAMAGLMSRRKRACISLLPHYFGGFFSRSTN